MTDNAGDGTVHERFMREALAEAELAAQAGDVPVGCVLVRDGEIIARAHNHRQRVQDPTAHAELIALRAASQSIGSFRLIGVTAYVTLEPCPMCAGALVNARVPRVVYGCDDPKAGAVRSLYNIGTDARLNHRFELVAGVLGDACSAQLSGFFADLRRQRARSESEP
jgi:tRNA(adenine34) deaminase